MAGFNGPTQGKGYIRPISIFSEHVVYMILGYFAMSRTYLQHSLLEKVQVKHFSMSFFDVSHY